MLKAFKYKFLQLAVHPAVFWMLLGMLLLYNFQALANSGGLASGRDGFNDSVKYQLLANNYTFVVSFFGLLYAVFLGSRIAGRDIETGHLGILLCSYPDRAGYYLASLAAAALYLLVALLALTVNLLLLLWVFQVAFPAGEIAGAFLAQYLNALVLLTATGLFSVLAPSGAAFLGLGAYAYYSLYTFNELPFVRLPLLVRIDAYREVLCLFLPVRNVLMPSYTPAEILQIFAMEPLGLPPGLFQAAYALGMAVAGALLFRVKDL